MVWAWLDGSLGRSLATTLRSLRSCSSFPVMKLHMSLLSEQLSTMVRSLCRRDLFSPKKRVCDTETSRFRIRLSSAMRERGKAASEGGGGWHSLRLSAVDSASSFLRCGSCVGYLPSLTVVSDAQSTPNTAQISPACAVLISRISSACTVWCATSRTSSRSLRGITFSLWRRECTSSTVKRSSSLAGLAPTLMGMSRHAELVARGHLDDLGAQLVV